MERRGQQVKVFAVLFDAKRSKKLYQKKQQNPKGLTLTHHLGIETPSPPYVCCTFSFWIYYWN